VSIIEVSLSSAIEEKVAWAEYTYEKFSGRLLRDKGVLDGSKGLREAIGISRMEMARTGIARICAECEEREGGSCCGAGLENHYNAALLLINLLLNRKLPKTRRDEKSCFFLGEAGCLLYARHVICINYLCKKITNRIDSRQIIRLRQEEGQELQRLFLLHERVKRVLRGQGEISR
jgi:hypothetical protein